MRRQRSSDSTGEASTDEPAFELPSSAWTGPERRLAQAYANRLLARRKDSSEPLEHEFRGNAVRLEFTAEGPVVVAVGAAVAASFGLEPGALEWRDDSLGGALIGACAALASTVVPFEAAIEARGACFLLRGVLLPVDAGAEAVLSWKQVLDDDATARLRAELLAAMRTDSQPAGAAVDAFAK